MRNMLALFALVVIAFAGVGYFRGWYHVETTTSSPGHRQVSLDFDNQKISEDVKTGIKSGETQVNKFLDSKGEKK